MSWQPTDRAMRTITSKPKDCGPVTVSSEEMCFIQDMPVKLIGHDVDCIQIPQRCAWAAQIVTAAVTEEQGRGQRLKDWYIYLTMKVLYVTPYNKGTREGWHCDGYGSDDVHYLWSDALPTEFFVGQIQAPFDRSQALGCFGDSLRGVTDTWMPNRSHLVRSDSGCIHRVSVEPYSGIRSFVRVGFSRSRFNLFGNAHNELLDYQWDMVPRTASRNDPAHRPPPPNPWTHHE